MLKDWWYARGLPFYHWLQRLYGEPSILKYRIITLAWILLTAVFQYKILKRFTPVREFHCRYLTILALIWPFYHSMVSTVFVGILLCPVFFYAGWYSYLCLKEKKSHPLLYLPSLLLLLLSFNAAQHLTYHYAFMVIYAISLRGYSLEFDPGELKSQLWGFVRQNWVPMFIPLVFFYLKGTFYPVVIAYNKIQLLSLKSFLTTIKNIFRIITEPTLSILYSIPTFWFVLIPGLIAGTFILFKYFKKDPYPNNQKYVFGLIAIGFALIITHAFTYGVVWKSIKIMSIKTRHAFSGGLAYGLFFLGGVQWLFDKYWVHRKHLIQPVLLLFLFAMILVDWNFHLMWQARWAKTVSIIHNLKQQNPVSNANIYFLRDNFPLGVDTRETMGDFTFMLIEAWEENKNIGITSHWQHKKTETQAAQEMIKAWENRHYKETAGFDPKGCLAEIDVSPKKYHQQVIIGFRYLFYRWLDPENLSQFLQDLTDIKLRSLHIDARGQPCP